MTGNVSGKLKVEVINKKIFSVIASLLKKIQAFAISTLTIFFIDCQQINLTLDVKKQMLN